MTHAKSVVADPAPESALAAVTVLDLEGLPVPLGDLWSEGPALVVWLRHYG